MNTKKSATASSLNANIASTTRTSRSTPVNNGVRPPSPKVDLNHTSKKLPTSPAQKGVGNPLSLNRARKSPSAWEHLHSSSDRGNSQKSRGPTELDDQTLLSFSQNVDQDNHDSEQQSQFERSVAGDPVLQNIVERQRERETRRNAHRYGDNIHINANTNFHGTSTNSSGNSPTHAASRSFDHSHHHQTAMHSLNMSEHYENSNEGHQHQHREEVSGEGDDIHSDHTHPLAYIGGNAQQIYGRTEDEYKAIKKMIKLMNDEDFLSIYETVMLERDQRVQVAQLHHSPLSAQQQAAAEARKQVRRSKSGGNEQAFSSRAAGTQNKSSNLPTSKPISQYHLLNQHISQHKLQQQHQSHHSQQQANDEDLAKMVVDSEEPELNRVFAGPVNVNLIATSGILGLDSITVGSPAVLQTICPCNTSPQTTTTTPQNTSRSVSRTSGAVHPHEKMFSGKFNTGSGSNLLQLIGSTPGSASNSFVANPGASNNNNNNNSANNQPTSNLIRCLTPQVMVEQSINNSLSTINNNNAGLAYSHYNSTPSPATSANLSRCSDAHLALASAANGLSTHHIASPLQQNSPTVVETSNGVRWTTSSVASHSSSRPASRASYMASANQGTPVAFRNESDDLTNTGSNFGSKRLLSGVNTDFDCIVSSLSITDPATINSSSLNNHNTSYHNLMSPSGDAPPAPHVARTAPKRITARNSNALATNTSNTTSNNGNYSNGNDQHHSMMSANVMPRYERGNTISSISSIGSLDDCCDDAIANAGSVDQMINRNRDLVISPFSAFDDRSVGSQSINSSRSAKTKVLTVDIPAIVTINHHSNSSSAMHSNQSPAVKATAASSSSKSSNNNNNSSSSASSYAGSGILGFFSSGSTKKNPSSTPTKSKR